MSGDVPFTLLWYTSILIRLKILGRFFFSEINLINLISFTNFCYNIQILNFANSGNQAICHFSTWTRGQQQPYKLTPSVVSPLLTHSLPRGHSSSLTPAPCSRKLCLQPDASIVTYQRAEWACGWHAINALYHGSWRLQEIKGFS